MSTPASACATAWRHQHVERLVVEDVAVAHQRRHGRAWCRGRAPRRRSRRSRARAFLSARHGAAAQVVGAFRLPRRARSSSRVGIDREERHRRDAELGGLLHCPQQAGRSSAAPRRAWMRRPPLGAAVLDEDRPDQVVDGQRVLAHQAAGPGGPRGCAACGCGGRGRADPSPTGISTFGVDFRTIAPSARTPAAPLPGTVTNPAYPSKSPAFWAGPCVFVARMRPIRRPSAGDGRRSAWSRSARMSSICSMPTDSRT